MGCGNSRINQDGNIDNYKLALEKMAFNKRHGVIEKNLGLGIRDLDKIIKLGSRNMNQDFEILLKNIILKCDNCGLDVIDIKYAILEILSQEYIQEFLEFKDYDVLSFAKENLNFLNFKTNNKTKEKLIGMINCATRILSKIQKGIIIKLEENQFNDYININTILNNLKFNYSYQTELMILKINKFSVTNLNTCKMIGESLYMQRNLSTLVIDIQDPIYKITQEFIPNMNYIFNQFKYIKDLKIFIFRNMNLKDEIYSTNMMENAIINLLERDILIGISISKINLSDAFLIKIGAIIEKSKNLKFILFEAYNDPVSLDKIIRGMLRNTSLNVIVFAGFSIDVTKVIEYKQVQKFNNQLNYFEFLDEFKFNI